MFNFFIWILPAFSSLCKISCLPWEPVSVSICNSESCKSAAEFIKTNMDETENPCHDFYQFACGGYMDKNQILDNETKASTFRDLIKQAKFVREDVLASTKESLFDSEKKAKALYKQCVDDDAIEKEKGQPVLKFLDSILGGWPLITPGWNSTKFDFIETLIENRAYLNQPLFSMLVDKNLWDPSFNSLHFDEPETWTGVDVLRSGDKKMYLDSYSEYIRNTTELLKRDSGVRVDPKDEEEMIQDIMELGNSLVLSKLNSAELRSLTRYQNMSLEDFQKTILPRSSLGRNLLKYVQRTVKSVGLDWFITPQTKVTIASVDYFSKLDEILWGLEKDAFGNRKLANYIGWRVIGESIQYLSKDYRDAQSAHQQRTKGQVKLPQTPTAERCAEHAIAVLPVAVGAIYVRDAVPETLKEKAAMMTKDIMDGFRQLLRQAKWMENSTLTSAFNNLDHMVANIAYNNILKSNLSDIDKHYEKVNENLLTKLEIQKSFFGSALAAMKFQNLDNLQRLSEPNMRYHPIRNYQDVTSVNAFYYPTANRIEVLTAILRPPFFDPDYPKYINYGKIGFVIGHETTHGFDDQGAKFDDQGLLRDREWSSETFQKYLELAESLRYQYGNYSISTGSVNGELTLGENIADNGGLKAAYNGYMLYKSRLQKQESILPGFENFTAEQLFFLSFGQTWCEKVRQKTERLHLLTSSHSPGRFRVNGPISNMPEFALAYNCPERYAMNPVHKNGVW